MVNSVKHSGGSSHVILSALRIKTQTTPRKSKAPHKKKRLIGTISIALGLLICSLPGLRTAQAQRSFAGFDRNLYPGDARMAALHLTFAFTGYWLTPPPGLQTNTWQGKREVLRKMGYGFLVLADGRLDAAIKATPRPDALGRQDATAAIAAAQHEGFPRGTILFLDQEEGGRLLPEQAAYLLAWTETVGASPFKPGAYLSGQPVPDGTGPDGKPQTITTAQDVRRQVAAKHLHPVALWVQQDGCPPAPGCVASPAPVLSLAGTPDISAWQYAQSPRRQLITRSCAKTYAADNDCYAGALTDLTLDLDAAASADPSHGR